MSRGPRFHLCALSQIGAAGYCGREDLTKLASMIKSFVFGILLGVVIAAGALYAIPVVDQVREESLIVVHPNAGNTESFHVNVPMDRIMIGAQDSQQQLPAQLEWPDGPQFANLRAELFKIRNTKDAVVGVASRIAASDTTAGEVIEWVLHLPARGSIYVTMEPQPREGGFRVGDMYAGTREFENLVGQVTERWVADTTGFDDAPAGRIELITAFESRRLDEPADAGDTDAAGGQK